MIGRYLLAALFIGSTIFAATGTFTDYRNVKTGRVAPQSIRIGSSSSRSSSYWGTGSRSRSHSGGGLHGGK